MCRISIAQHLQIYRTYCICDCEQWDSQKGQPPFLQGEISNGGDSIQVLNLPVTPGREQAHRNLDDYPQVAPPLDYRNTRSAYSTTGTRTSHWEKKTPPTMLPSDGDASFTNNNGEFGAAPETRPLDGIG